MIPDLADFSATFPNMKNLPVQEWITPSEAAAALGISTKSVGRLADRGKIRAIRTDGNHRRFAAADVEAILANDPWDAA